VHNGHPMPTIFVIDGVTISMNFDEHPPPHFHARIAEHAATYLLDGTLLSGSLPLNKDKVVREWAKTRRTALEKAWEDCLNGRNPGRIS